MTVDETLQVIPPLVVYLLTGVVVGLESLGIPLPGEIVLVSAALLSSRPEVDVDPLFVGIAASAGAVVGDSIGYGIGRRYGMSLFGWLGRRFPSHFGPGHVAVAGRLFERWGMGAVFFGRFVAVLRIFAGPLAGALRMPYPRFLVANVLGGVCWAGGTTAGIYYLGLVAETWLKRFSWAGLVVAVLAGVGIAVYTRRRTRRMVREADGSGEPDGPPGTVTPGP